MTVIEKLNFDKDLLAKHFAEWAKGPGDIDCYTGRGNHKDIVMISQYPNDPLNKTFIGLSNKRYLIARMPYEKVMELV